MSDNFITDEDLYKAVREKQKHAVYLPIPQTQRPPANEGDGNGNGVHVLKCARLLVLTIASSNWVVETAMFGAAKPTEFARDNVSLFLKVVQWAILAKLNIYLETLYDDVLAQTGMLQECGKRLFLPVPESKLNEFSAIIMTSLIPEEPIPVASASRKKSKKSSAASQSATSEMTPDDIVFNTFVSHKRIDSDTKFIDVINRMWMCSAEKEVNCLNFDMIDSAAGAEVLGDQGVSSDDRNSVFHMLDWRRAFESDQSKEWYDECRLPAWQRDPAHYFDPDAGMFIIHDLCFESFPFTVRMFCHNDGFLRGDADTLRLFLQQTVEVPMADVRTKLCELSQACGFRRRDQYMRMSDEETLRMFCTADGSLPQLRDFAHRARIIAPDPFAPTQGLTFSQQHEYLITPIAAKHKEVFTHRRKLLTERIADGRLDASELERVNDDVAEVISGALEAQSPGIPRMYAKVTEERKTLKHKLFPEYEEDDTPVAKMARKMFFFDSACVEGPALAGMDMVDRQYASYADILSTHLNTTPFQARVVLMCKTYATTLMKNTFGPQNGVCMQGTCDVGKSHCAKTLVTLFPTCQIQSENDASDKAYVMQDISMTIVWRDEMNFGGVADGPKARDDKTTRSAFSTGVLVYNQCVCGRLHSCAFAFSVFLKLLRTFIILVH